MDKHKYCKCAHPLFWHITDDGPCTAARCKCVHYECVYYEYNNSLDAPKEEIQPELTGRYIDLD